MKFQAVDRAAVTIIALALFGLAALSQPSSARAEEQRAPTVGSDTGNPESGRIEARITKLRIDLHITDGQMAQWNALAEIMRENARLLRASIADRAQIHRTTIVDKLYADRLEAQAQLKRLDRLIPVAEALYAVLTAEQKAKADAIFGRSRNLNDGTLDISQ